MKGLGPFTALAVVTLGTSLAASAQTLDQAITAKFALTKPTADHTDIVTAGAVITLKKDGLVTTAISANVKAQSTFKSGQIQPSFSTKMACASAFGKSSGVTCRTFVAGEKIWLIGVQTVNDGVVLQFLSDAISDVRYTTLVKVPFAKGDGSSTDQVLGQMSQFMGVDSGGSESAASSAPAKPAPPAAPSPEAAVAAPMAAIAPPPPPPDMPAAAPPTLEKGQTKDQVVAAFGQPVKVVKMGTKEIDYYKDMKVTFVNNKVSNVE